MARFFDDYQKLAHETSFHKTPSLPGLNYALLGLGNECGELQGKFKKLLRGDKPGLENKVAVMLATLGQCTDAEATGFRDMMAGELGDVLWYLSEVATMLGMSLDRVASNNIQKLRSRAAAGTIKGDGDDR